MTLTELSIKRPSFIVVIFAALTFLGVLCYNALSYELLPRFNAPVITISTIYPGAAPSEVETGVSKPIEDAVADLEGISMMRSMSMENLSLIIIEFDNGVDIDQALQDAQRKVNRIQAVLPTSAKAPSLSKVSSDEFPVLQYAVAANMSPRELTQFVKDRIKPLLVSTEGVAEVGIIGGEERQIRVNINPEKLKANKISILQVTQAIGQGNLDFPTGKVNSSDNELRVRLAGKFTDLDQLRNLVIFTHPMSGGQVHLSDVAEVYDGTKERDAIFRINGKDALGLVIKKQSDANAVDMAKSIFKRVEDAEKTYKDKNLKFTLAINSTDYTIQAADAVKHDLMIALFLVAAVILVFLHSLRDSFIVMLAIPCSFVATFIAIYLLGYTLNLMTMLGLTLVVGILVDDSIVVLENIHRHLHMGKDRRTAALDGRNEIGFTALSITLVDVVVFLPLALTNAGVVSVILEQFSMVIVIATLLSLFVSFTVTPLLASRFSGIVHFDKNTFWGRVNGAIEDRITALSDWYGNILTWALRHKIVTFALIGVLFVITGYVMSLGIVGSAFVERGDQGEAVVSIEVEKSSTMEHTSRVSNEAEMMLRKMPEVTTVIANIGGSSSAMGVLGAPNKSQITVKLKPATERKITTAEWMDKAKDMLRKDLGGARISIADISIAGGANQAPIQIVLSGADPDAVIAAGQEVKKLVQNTKGTTDIQLSVEGGVSEVKVELDKTKLAKYGLNTQLVGATMQNAFAGNKDSKYRDADGSEYEINVQLDKFDRKNEADVKQIGFVNNMGQNLTLEQFADVSASIGPAQLERTNRTASVKLDAQLRGRQEGEVATELEKKLKELQTQNKLPQGVSFEFIGNVKNQKAGFGAIGIAFMIGILLVYLLMVALYDNYVYPFVTLFAIPVAIIGALMALVLAKSTLSIFTMMGMVTMIGLVTKNSIMLVDFTNQAKAEGIPLFEALIQAGKVRLRPILMTTLAMVLGMIPVATATGAGASWKNGLGWVLIGGLTSSMILTLILVPCAYYIVDMTALRLRKLFNRNNDNTPKNEPELVSASH